MTIERPCLKAVVGSNRDCAGLNSGRPSTPEASEQSVSDDAHFVHYRGGLPRQSLGAGIVTHAGDISPNIGKAILTWAAVNVSPWTGFVSCRSSAPVCRSGDGAAIYRGARPIWAVR